MDLFFFLIYITLAKFYTLKNILKPSKEPQYFTFHSLVGWWELLECDTSKALIGSQCEGE